MAPLQVQPGTAAAAAAAAPEPPLHAAARQNQVEELRRLVEARASVEVKETAFGWGPLHVAAGSGAIQSIEALLELGASANAGAKDGEVPLHLAASEGHTQAIRSLAATRAEVNLVNADGETPLHVAVQHVGGKPGLGHLRALLELRADPSQKDKAGHDAFECAGLYTNRAEEVREVLQGANGPLCDPEDPWPETPGELPPGTDPVSVAESLRELGNKRFKDRRYAEAVKLYFKGKVFLPTGPAAFAPVAEGDEQGARARACSIAIGSNAAMCKFKLGEHDDCVRMCDGLLGLDPKNMKALYRKAMALRAQEDVDGGEAALKQALELEPNDGAVQKELAAIARQRKKDLDSEKRLAKRMFG